MSIRIAVARCAVGLLRGVQPASNISMMTMRPPQHGQGWIGLSDASVSAGALCDGFRMPAQYGRQHARDRAGVRKPPGKEGAGSGARLCAGAMGISLARSVQYGP